jgi:peptidoglycan L-alanyl-D-glutamate endopeptidase CwlK
MASRDPKVLRPELYAMYVRWDADMHAAGIDYILTCTERYYSEQDALYAQGRNGNPGRIVTNARGGQSAHQYRLAYNLVIMVNGKPDWHAEHPDWDRAIKMAEARGMQSLRPMESAHLQHPNWKQLAGIPL